ncbi:MAG: 2-oxo acid dehydrogenase subunit E2 [Marinobacterium sp.]|nr:2-oxo acid dehydrogenase subunit E2 [Marinobacterium sp.]
MGAMIDVMIPEGQLEGTEATLQSWLVAPGDTVKKDQPLAELETDKVTMEVAAPADGVVAELIAGEGDQVSVGMLLATLGDSEAARPVETTGSQAVATVTTPDAAPVTEAVIPVDARLSPAVRRILKEHPVDLSLVQGSGKGGRVTKCDLLRYLKNVSVAVQVPVQMPVQPVMPVAAAASVDEKTVSGLAGLNSTLRPHSTMRKRIADHMVDSLLHTAPHVTSIFEADLSAIQRHRARYKTTFAEQGVKLSYTAYFIAAAARALQAVPEVNSRFHDDVLELFHDCNIGVGTALGNDGLVVPVIHQVQDLNLMGIARRLQGLTDAAYSSSLKPSDMQGGTFTISNHGVSGSLVATPIIINQPQNATLGIGKLEKRVIVKEIEGVDTMVIRPMCYISLTIDHRALDGYQTNTFLARLVNELENWPLD